MSDRQIAEWCFAYFIMSIVSAMAVALLGLFIMLIQELTS